MSFRRHTLAALVLFGGGIPVVAAFAAGSAAPTPEQALGLAPIQPFVDYAKPAPNEVKQCTIKPEKEGNVTSWVVRNPQGEILRKFADTNNDNTVDLWCYYQDGLEVYRDIDSNFNLKADQYRWFHTAGSRWGIDQNEDRKIDSWKQISPQEVAEQVVLALKTRDATRFNLVLLTPTELTELGLGKERADHIAGTTRAATSGFAKLASDQKVVGPQSRYVDFNSARPAAIPAGTSGSTKDIIVCDNASALVQTDTKHDQVYLGTLVQVGNAWKLIELPTAGGDTQAPSTFLTADSATDHTPINTGAPSEEIQKLMANLEQLDKAAEGLSGDKLTANISQRADLLQRVAEATEDAEMKAQWYRQLIDTISVEVQKGNFAQGIDRLTRLEKQLAGDGGNDDLQAHANFQRMWAQYALDQTKPDVDAAKLQEQWLTDLQKFVTDHGKSSDAAEALLQLGMYQELVGKAEEARKWYNPLVTNFPKAPQSAKARGALRRLDAVGRPLPLRGQDIQGGNPIDIGTYRGKYVIVHCWATWGPHSKEDMIFLKDFYAKNRTRGIEIVGINLDQTAATAKQFLAENQFPWKQMFEEGGLEGRLANELGIISVPLMMLVDQKGNVVNNNIHAEELDAALAKLIQGGEADANALRSTPNQR